MNLTKSPNVVLIKNLTFRYPGSKSNLLENINLKISRGDKVGITGGNGCGKSTLSKILLGIYTYQSGSVSIFNRPAVWHEHFANVGYIGDPGHNAEELGLPTHLTINQVIMTLVNLYTMSDTEIAIDEMLEKLGLAALRDRKISNLSTGERKRLMTCITFLRKPDLLILDEPFDGLDEHIVVYIKALMKGVMANKSMSVLLISHSQIEIDTYTDRVYRIANKTLEPVQQQYFHGSLSLGDEVNEIKGRTGEIMDKMILLLKDEKSFSGLHLSLNHKSSKV